MYQLLKANIWLFVLLLLPFGLTAQNFEFKGSVNPNVVGKDDYFELQYVLEQVEGLANFKGPNLQGFDLLNQSQGSSMHQSIYNGQRTTKRYIITTYILRPKKIGHFTIPPASVEYNGEKVNSNTVKLEVVEQAPKPKYVDPFDAFFSQRAQRLQQQQQQQQPERQQPAEMSDADIKKNIFIRVEVDNKKPYKGEQIIASYKLYTRLPMNMSITQLPSLNGFWSEDFVLPKVPKPTTELVNGVEYQVFVLKKTALFAQESGKLTLDPTIAEGTVRILERTKSNPFKDDPFFSFFMDDPFFDDAFFNNINYRDVPIKISSAPISIDVLPLPQPQPSNFSGGVGQFKVNSILENKKYTTDDAIPYQVEIEGLGNTKLVGLNDVNWPKELGVTEPAIRDTIVSRSPQIISKKIITYYLNPQQSGKYNIPSIELSYFNTATKQYEPLVIPSKDIIVEEGLGSVSQVEDFSNNIQKSGGKNTLLYAILGSIFGISLLGIFLYFRKQQKTNIKDVKQSHDTHLGVLEMTKQRLMKASEVKDIDGSIFYEELNKALWLYIAQKINVDLGKLNKSVVLNDLSARLPDEVSKEIANITKICEQALYAPMKNLESRNDILDRTQNVIVKLESIL